MLPYFSVPVIVGQGVYATKNKFFHFSDAVVAAAKLAEHISDAVKIYQHRDSDKVAYAAVQPNGKVALIRTKPDIEEYAGDVMVSLAEVQASVKDDSLSSDISEAIASLAMAVARAAKKKAKPLKAPKGISIRLIVRLLMKLPKAQRKPFSKRLYALLKKQAGAAEFKKLTKDIAQLVSKSSKGKSKKAVHHRKKKA